VSEGMHAQVREGKGEQGSMKMKVKRKWERVTRHNHSLKKKTTFHTHTHNNNNNNNNNLQGGAQHAHFDPILERGVWCHRWCAVDLQQPCLQLVIQEDIVAVDVERVMTAPEFGQRCTREKHRDEHTHRYRDRSTHKAERRAWRG
jgi:hypothetical protein